MRRRKRSPYLRTNRTSRRLEHLEDRRVLATMVISAAAPVVDGADIAMLNVTGQSDAGGDQGHIWADRPVQGQTFTTGAAPNGYQLTSFTMRNFNNNVSGNTATWTGRIGTVSGSNFTQIATETSNNSISYVPNDFLTFSFATPVNLNPNTVYAFELGSSGSGFVTANNANSNYAGGEAISSGDNSTPVDNDVLYRGVDRVFHVNMTANFAAVDDPAGGHPNATYSTTEDANLTVADGPNDLFGNDFGNFSLLSFAAASANGVPVSVNANGGFTYTPTAAAATQQLDEGQILNDTFTYSILENGAPLNEDGQFRVAAFQETGGGSDTAVDDTLEALGIWSTLGMSGAGTPGVISANGKTYGINNFEADTEVSIDYNSGGNFGVNLAYASVNSNGPGGAGGVVTGGDDLSVRAQAFLRFTAGGTFSIAAASDDGRRISLTPVNAPGYAGFSAEGGNQRTADTDPFVVYFNGTTGHQNTKGAFTVNAGDVLLLDSFFFERGGGDSFEIAIKAGSDVTTAATDTGNGWALLTDGILGVELSSDYAAASQDSATVTVQVTGVNDAPVAIANTNTITEALNGLPATNTATGNVLTNDTDVDDPNSSFTVTTAGTIAGTYGSLVLNANGTYTYTLNDSDPVVNALLKTQSLTDVFPYTMSDNHSGGNVKTASSSLTITINGVNDAPLATANTATVTEDTSLTDSGNLLTDNDGSGADSDPDSPANTLNVTQVGSETNPANNVNGTYGSLDWDTNGSYSYSLNNGLPAVQALGAGQTLTDSFTYTVTDPVFTGNGLYNVQILGSSSAPQPGNVTANWLAVWDAIDGGAGPTGTVGGFNITANAVDTEVDFDYSGAGNFPGSRNTNSINNNGPGGAGGPLSNTDNYSIRARTFLAFSAGGTYTIAIASDDGRRLELTPAAPGSAPGYTGFSSVGGQAGSTLTNGNTVIGWDGGTGHNQTFGVFTVAQGDILELDAFYYEGTGGDSGEISFAAGAQGSFNTTAFRLLTDGIQGVALSTVNNFTQDSTSTATLTVTINGNNDAPVANNDPGTPGDPAYSTSEGSILTVPNGSNDVLANDTDPDTFDTLRVAMPTTNTVQTFDGGGTVFAGQQSGTAPAATVTGGGPTGSYLRLTTDGVNNQNNAIAFNQTHVGPFESVTAEFDFRATSIDAAADGFAFVLIPVATYGTSGNGPAFTAEEPSIADAFGVGFDLHPAATENHVSLHWNNAVVGNVNVNPVNLDAGVFHHAKIEVSPVAGGSNVTVTLTPDVYGTPGTPVIAYNNVFVAGLNPYESRVMFRGRTGGLNYSGDLDNIEVSFAPASINLVSTKGGDVILNQDGSFSYDPNGLFESLGVGATDTDTFTYTAVDRNGSTSTATVTVTITGENDAPVATPDTGAANEDGPAVSIVLTANDTDIDTGDDTEILAIDTTGTTGAVTINADNDSVTYDPNGSFESLAVGETAVDTFTYTVTDGNGGTSTTTVTVTIAGVNDLPTGVDAAGPYTVSEGASVMLSGSFTDVDTNDTHTYTWTVNGNVVASATTLTPTISWAELQTAGVDDGNPSANFTVELTVDDMQGTPVTSAAGTLTLNNAPPMAFVSAPVEVVPGSDVTITASADDPSNADDAGTFTYEIDYDYDGVLETIDATMTGPMSGATFTTQYGALGTFTVAVFATDKDGGRSLVATTVVNVVPVAQVGDDVFAGGTDGASDRIIFFPTNNGIRVRYNNTVYPLSGGEFTITPGSTRLLAFGRGGADFMVVAGRIDAPAEFDGGIGNDYLAGGTENDTLWGGAGNDIILAGEGDNYVDGGDDADRLESRSGLDVIFGGAGNDRLNGGAGDDILDAGAGNDFVFGDLGNDLLVGGSGLDTLNGHVGNDIILGGDHADQIFGGVGNDLLIGGDGADRLRGDAGDDDVIGGSSDLDDDVQTALDAMMASLGTLDLATASPAVSTAVNNWFTTGTDRSGFGAFADDGLLDDLTGGTGTDEFHSAADMIRDLRATEGDATLP